MVPELRPRGIGEMLDAAVAVYRGCFVPLLRVAALVVVPVQILTTIVYLSARPDSFGVSLTGPTPRYTSHSVQLAATLVVFAVTIVSNAFVVAVCTRIVADAYIDNDDTGREGRRNAERRMFAVLGVSILVALSIGAGALACFVGAVVPLVLFAVAVPVLILERLPVFGAMGRSVRLTRNNFFRTLGLVVTAQLLSTGLTAGLAAVATFAVRGGSSTAAAVVTRGLANAVAATLTTPFVAATTVVLYFDLRIRNEAFDVQLMMQRAAARVTGRAGGPPVEPAPTR